MTAAVTRPFRLAAVAIMIAQAAAAGDDAPRPRAEVLQEAFIDVAAKVLPSVVAVTVRKAGDAAPPQGSGVIIDKAGHIVTNEHVVRGAETITVVLPSGRSYKAQLKGADPRSDLAVIRIAAKEPLTPIKWADSDKLKIGQWAVAVGNPFGFSNTLTVGVVSAVDRPLPPPAMSMLRMRSGRDVYYGALIQTDAAIGPGNSGGALVDLRGRLIGINSLVGSDARSGRGVGFAIPANHVKGRLEALKAGKAIRYGWLGVRPKDLRGSLSAAFGMQEGQGVLVDQVVEKSPAAEAGIKRGWVITRFGGRKVESTDRLMMIVGMAEVDTEIKMIVRNPLGKDPAKDIELTVKLGERPHVAARPPAGDAPPIAVGWRGMELAPVTGKSGGVPVAEVQPGSPAAVAGLRNGMRVDEVGARITSMIPVQSKETFDKAVAKLTGPVLIHAEPAGYLVIEEK